MNVNKIKTKISGLNLIIILFLIILSQIGCSYSFTGSSVPPHLKSIAIPYCIDRSGSGEPTMADDFTNALIDNFLNDNSFSIEKRSEADAILECTITSLSDAPTVIEGGEDVTTRRITIKAKVLYRDMVLKKTVFNKSFSNYGDYSTSGNVDSEREEAIQNAIERITEDILLAVVSDW